MEVGEALNVQHVDLVDEEDARDELGDAVVDVLVDNLERADDEVTHKTELGLHGQKSLDVTT